jgi:heme-degrading monooxygenase HmoA
MIYLIDVIDAAAAPDYARRWQDHALTLQARHNLRKAELFEVSEPIRDVNYALLSIYSFDSADDSEAALRAGLTSDIAAGVVERTQCNLAIMLSELVPVLPGHIWMINPFEVGEAEIPGVLEMWDKAKNHMMAHAGFINARLFRSAAPSTKYGLFNVSQWRSAAAFKESLGDKAYDRHRERSMNYRLHPSLCTQMHSLNFDQEAA